MDERSGASTNTGNSKLAPNNIPVPWYSQKIADALTRIALWLLR